MGAYDSVVFDHDGVLVDLMDGERRTESFRRHAERTFEKHSVAPSDETLEFLSGSVTYEELHSLSDRLDADPNAVWRARDDALAAVLRDAAREGHKKPYPDIDSLADVDVPLGVASNNQERVVEFILDQYSVRDQFGTVRAREPTPGSLREKKPEPTYLRHVRDELGVTNPLFVGDKATDVQAGTRAGLDVAFIRRSHNADRTLTVEPTHEVTGLDDVVALLE